MQDVQWESWDASPIQQPMQRVERMHHPHQLGGAWCLLSLLSRDHLNFPLWTLGAFLNSQSRGPVAIYKKGFALISETQLSCTSQ